MLACIRCKSLFVFTADEQLFFREKGFTNNPKLCRACRAKREGKRPSQQETQIACAECGNRTTVPFLPTRGRPVLCFACFLKSKNPR
ncbi:MAG TPA: zinc-ribbon domain containing protein [Acidobacteriaceae bacterium]|nr:zinc-ribbon domain containing protein [Acidobacteriaceae bacterium]